MANLLNRLRASRESERFNKKQVTDQQIASPPTLNHGGDDMTGETETVEELRLAAQRAASRGPMIKLGLVVLILVLMMAAQITVALISGGR